MRNGAGMIRLKRVYESPATKDGFRVLVERLWPRGITKAEAHLDLWMREIVPGTDLRKNGLPMIRHNRRNSRCGTKRNLLRTSNCSISWNKSAAKLRLPRCMLPMTSGTIVPPGSNGSSRRNLRVHSMKRKSVRSPLNPTRNEVNHHES
jgi:hypothetical protein